MKNTRFHPDASVCLDTWLYNFAGQQSKRGLDREEISSIIEDLESQIDEMLLERNLSKPVSKSELQSILRDIDLRSYEEDGDDHIDKKKWVSAGDKTLLIAGVSAALLFLLLLSSAFLFLTGTESGSTHSNSSLLIYIKPVAVLFWIFFALSSFLVFLTGIGSLKELKAIPQKLRKPAWPLFKVFLLPAFIVSLGIYFFAHANLLDLWKIAMIEVLWFLSVAMLFKFTMSFSSVRVNQGHFTKRGQSLCFSLLFLIVLSPVAFAAVTPVTKQDIYRYIREGNMSAVQYHYPSYKESVLFDQEESFLFYTLVFGRNNQTALSVYFMEHEPSVNEANQGQRPVIHRLLFHQRLNSSLIEKMHRSGVDLNQTDDSGQTLLMHALVYFKHNDGLIEALVNHSNVNLQDKNGQTALHHAAAWGGADEIQMLIDTGADPYLADANGKLPIHRFPHLDEEGTRILLGSMPDYEEITFDEVPLPEYFHQVGKGHLVD